MNDNWKTFVMHGVKGQGLSQRALITAYFLTGVLPTGEIYCPKECLEYLKKRGYKLVDEKTNK